MVSSAGGERTRRLGGLATPTAARSRQVGRSFRAGLGACAVGLALGAPPSAQAGSTGSE